VGPLRQPQLVTAHALTEAASRDPLVIPDRNKLDHVPRLAIGRTPISPANLPRQNRTTRTTLRCLKASVADSFHSSPFFPGFFCLLARDSPAIAICRRHRRLRSPARVSSPDCVPEHRLRVGSGVLCSIWGELRCIGANSSPVWAHHRQSAPRRGLGVSAGELSVSIAPMNSHLLLRRLSRIYVRFRSPARPRTCVTDGAAAEVRRRRV
jgi:hypothetical protein